MSKLPRVAGLILCNRAEMNTATVEMSLVGLFHHLEFSSWPAPPRPFTVYTELYDALAEGIMELAVFRLETGERIYYQQRWFASSDRGLTFPIEWRVRKCRFPAPGRYLLQLQLDGQELSRRFLEIKARETVP